MVRRARVTWRQYGTVLLASVLLIAWAYEYHAVAADDAVDYPGTVVLVDVAAGKLAVKKEGGGTRFTFVVNGKTQFQGSAKSLKDLQKGDNVTVTYVVNGSQYLAQRITKK